MGLAPAVEGEFGISQEITWVQLERTAVPLDLTGATITGVLHELRSQVSRAIVGTLLATDPLNGIFRWTYDIADTLPLIYAVQFTAVYAPTSNPLAKSFQTTWYVEPCLVAA